MMETTQEREMDHVGRNDPCPCGSGKKYKKCCMARQAAPRIPGREEALSRTLADDMLRSCARRMRDQFERARTDYFGGRDDDVDLEEDERRMRWVNFADWLVHDWRAPDGKSLIEHYVEGHGRLRPDELDVLEKMKRSFISLYDVVEVREDEGARLRDLLLGGELDITEKMATSVMARGDIFVTRLLPFDGTFVASGGYCYRRQRREGLVDTVKERFRRYRRANPGGTMEQCLKGIAPVLFEVWSDDSRTTFTPRLSNMSGDPLLFSKAFFDVEDAGKLREAMDRVEAFRRRDDADAFEWDEEADAPGGSLHLGTLTIDAAGHKAVLECNSRERLERGKKMILDAAGGCVRHRADEHEDPVRLLEEREKSGKEPARREEAGRLPRDIEQSVLTEVMRKHYEKWLDDSIPALDGKSPREMVKTKIGRAKVRALLENIDNTEEHKKKDGEPCFDTAWIWERLGLKKDE